MKSDLGEEKKNRLQGGRQMQRTPLFLCVDTRGESSFLEEMGGSLWIRPSSVDKGEESAVLSTSATRKYGSCIEGAGTNLLEGERSFSYGRGGEKCIRRR